MKKVLFTLMCIVAMLATSLNVKAQEVTIPLMPGWNWISYPSTDTVDFATALGSFTPMRGDRIINPFDFTEYTEEGWDGDLEYFYPGYGYMYYSSRNIPVFLTFTTQQPIPQVLVTTLEPTDITQNSATCGGNVASSNGDYVSVTLRGICWSTNPNPTFNDNYIEAGNGLGSFTVSMTELTPGITYYVRAYAVTADGTYYGEQKTFVTSQAGVWIDLGLPSGLLWATCNVGADAPEEYGDYFAWGETQPKDTYNWSTYQYCNGTYNTLTKYCNNSSYSYNGFTDNLTTLLPEDDAATANWGSDWRMPTQAEFQELLDNTTVTLTTQNGVNGHLFTASNGNSLFLPAAGYYYNSDFNSAGSNGFYWSSSLCTDYPDAAWNFSSGFNMSGYSRYYGFTVRPVRSSGQNASFLIDATANPAEGGVISGGGSYFEGTECTLTATANEGYTFTNWTENDEVVSTNATYTFTVNANRTLAANFTTQIVYNFDFELGNIGFQSDYVFSPSGIINQGHYCVDNNTSNHGGGYGWPELIGSTGRFMLVNGFGGSANPNKVVWAPQQSIVVTPNTNYVFSCYVANLYQSFYGIIYPAKLQLKINGQDVGSLYNLPSDNDWHIWTVAWNSENATQADIQIVDCFTGDSGMGDDFALDNIAFVTEAENYTITITANLINGGMVSGGGTYEEGAECTLTATPNSGYTFTNWIENGEVVSTEATYTFTVTGNRDLVANFAVSGGGDHAYVDLGLPSGLLWATCNVGADNPEEYGDYFAWGETQPKDTYNWNTYQYCNGTYNTLTKYCNMSSYGYNGFTDNLTTLLPEDDAVTANWGSDWRMPTKDEWLELYQNTTVTWTTQNGVNGRLFTASNGNSLFLPAAGYRFYSSLDLAGSHGLYWSSSLYTGYPYYAWYFFFSSGNYDMSSYFDRPYGFTVRPVCSLRQN